MRNIFLTVVVVSTMASSGSFAAQSASWPDTPIARVSALAVLQSLNADLLSHDSATLTLDRWCNDHKLADHAKIVAEPVKGVDKPATTEIRAALKVSETEKVGYRRVRLMCGERVLSDADNWYVPSRLTADMNKALETTDAAFGRVVKPLNFQRHTLSAKLLWQPLPEGWDMGAAIPAATDKTLELPDHVIEHKALLSLPDGAPISMVVESYTRHVLDFTPPALK